MNIVWHSGNEIPELHKKQRTINGFKVGGWQESDLLVMTENGKDYTLGNYVVEEWGASYISDIFGSYAPIAWAYVPVLDEGAVKVFERSNMGTDMGVGETA